MKVIFIKNDEFNDNIYSLTIGKLYTILDKIPDLHCDYLYRVCNDSRYYWWYPSDSFKLIEEVREEKLNDLGIK